MDNITITYAAALRRLMETGLSRNGARRFIAGMPPEQKLRIGGQTILHRKMFEKLLAEVKTAQEDIQAEKA